ncbi:MAG: hypothetical protein V2A76_09535 [Planctomycetota bacterium]
MGAMSIYRCGACGYEATVCGRRDLGMLVEVETRVCTECRAVVDVALGRPALDSKADEESMPPLGPLRQCPYCERPVTQVWPADRPCPRCDGTMDSSQESLILWD